MIAIIFLLMITYGPLQGEQNIMYLYTRLKFDWNEKDFAAFYAVQFGLQIFGSFLALIFLVKYLKWRDETLGILAFASSMLACGVYAFAYKGTIFYLGAVFDLFSGTAPIAMRSLISKLVHAHELGKTNSVFGICELLAHLIFTTLYITLYSKTLYIIPGAMFLITSVLKCLGIVIFIWLYRHSNRHRKHKKEINT
ncbi:hypothetical protein HHI36_020541 [Cryptolaemus montrouzieri]|uniref:Uncharacterized protein n=1 Tax=Cryptolaemus montrouzieri TaxID=559131 RepID=A0ABD2NAZ6_9CUCU